MPMLPANDPTLRSFIDVSPESHFPIQNLPFGVFQRPGEIARIGVAIGDFVLDLTALSHAHLLGVVRYCGDLNLFMEAGREAIRSMRQSIAALLRHDEPTLRDNYS